MDLTGVNLMDLAEGFVVATSVVVVVIAIGLDVWWRWFRIEEERS